MDTTFHGASYFYLVPVIIFLPLILWALWSFGLKDVFRRTDAEQRAMRQDAKIKARDVKRRLEKSGGMAVRPVTEPPRTIASWIGRAVAYAAYACVLAAFSAWPPYTYRPLDTGQIKLSLSVPGERAEACQKRTREALMKLPPNMRAPMQCSRARHAVTLSVLLDGQPLFDGSRSPAGLSADGASSFYEKFTVPAGRHTVAVRLSLDGGKTFDHVLDAPVEMAPGQVVVVGFGGAEKALYLR